MRGFMLDESGDVVIENGNIKMVDGNELIKQCCETVIGTNKGEWFLNSDEGINFDNIITKKPDFDLIRGEILLGLQQVDENFKLDTFNYNFDRNKRSLSVYFTASTLNATVTGTYTY